MNVAAAAAPLAVSAPRALLALAGAALAFVAVYRVEVAVARARGQRHFRHMLVFYEAAGPARRKGWLWQVTLAPALAALSGARAVTLRAFSGIPRWANRHLLGSQIGIAGQDLILIRLGGIAMAAVAAVATNGNLAVIVGGLLVGTIVPILLARRRSRRRRLLFAQQLPQVLTVMITALRAGRSLAQTIDVIAEQVAQPASAEFLLVAQKRRVGVDLSDALKELAERVENADVQLLVNALVVQRATGGNLVPVLETIYATVRERLAFQGEIRTMTAQVRMTAWVITALPFGLFGILLLLNPTGLSFFWTQWPLGPALLGGALGLIVLGNLVMRRMLVIR